MVCVVLIGLVACSTSQTASSSETVSTFPKTDSSGFDKGLLEGTLEIQDGCVRVAQKDSNDLIPLAFEEDSATLNDGEVVYHDTSFTSGDDIKVPGGFASLKNDIDVADGCESAYNIWRVSPISDIK